jgi:hypothetical protein
VVWIVIFLDVGWGAPDHISMWADKAVVDKYKDDPMRLAIILISTRVPKYAHIRNKQVIKRVIIDEPNDEVFISNEPINI